MRSIRFTEAHVRLQRGLMGSSALPFSTSAASPERTAESKSVPAAAVLAREDWPRKDVEYQVL